MQSHLPYQILEAAQSFFGQTESKKSQYSRPSKSHTDVGLARTISSEFDLVELEEVQSQADSNTETTVSPLPQNEIGATSGALDCHPRQQHPSASARYRGTSKSVPLQEESSSYTVAVENTGDIIVEPVRPEPWYWPFHSNWHVVLSLVLIALLLVFFSAVDNVLWTRISKQMQVFAYLVSQVFYPLAFVIAIWPCLLLRSLYRKWAHRNVVHAGINRSRAWKDKIYAQTTSNHWRHFSVMAAFDATAGFLAMYPVIYLSPAFIIALGQTIVPINMLASRIYLGRRYEATHILSAGVICAGVVVTLLPLFDSFSVFARSENMIDSSPALLALWVVLLVLSKIPAAMGHVYKERYLKQLNLDPLLSTACIATVQLPLSLILMPLIMVPLPPPALSVPPSQIGHYLHDAARCFAGHWPHDDGAYGFPPALPDFNQLNFTNTVGNLTAHALHQTAVLATSASPAPAFIASNISSGNTTVLQSPPHWHSTFNLDKTHCQYTWLVFIAFIFANGPFNVLHNMLIKATTANVAIAVAMLRIGVGDILFAWFWLAGAAYQAITPQAVLSLTIVALGVAVFWARPEKAPPARFPNDTAFHRTFKHVTSQQLNSDSLY